MSDSVGESKPYEDYNENEYVESLGGRDLMAQQNTPGTMNQYADMQIDPADLEEQRRVASLQTAQSLGLTDVDQLLSASEKIEKYLKGEK